jgi:integrase
MSSPKRLRGGEADPIFKLAQVDMIYSQLKRLKCPREAELFIIGCNCALRISDLLQLRNDDIIRKKVAGYDDRFTGVIKQLKEKKTGKVKELTINWVGMKHIDMWMALNPDNNYIFQGHGNRSNGGPITSSWVNRKFKEVRDHLALDYRFSTHSMRKTFGYHAYKSGTPIEVLSKLFNHVNTGVTLAYIGITKKVVTETYLENVIGAEVGE